MLLLLLLQKYIYCLLATIINLMIQITIFKVNSYCNCDNKSSLYNCAPLVYRPLACYCTDTSCNLHTRQKWFFLSVQVFCYLHNFTSGRPSQNCDSHSTVSAALHVVSPVSLEALHVYMAVSDRRSPTSQHRHITSTVITNPTSVKNKNYILRVNIQKQHDDFQTFNSFSQFDSF